MSYTGKELQSAFTDPRTLNRIRDWDAVFGGYAGCKGTWAFFRDDKVTIASGAVQTVADIGGGGVTLTQATAGNRASLSADVDAAGRDVAVFASNHYYDISGYTWDENAAWSIVTLVKPSFTALSIIAGKVGSGMVRAYQGLAQTLGGDDVFRTNYGDQIAQTFARAGYQLVISTYDGSTRVSKIAIGRSDFTSSTAATSEPTVSGVYRLGASASGVAGNVAFNQLWNIDLSNPSNAAALADVQDFADAVLTGGLE